MSLIHRHPSQVANLREMAKETYLKDIDQHEEDYARLRKASDPETFAEWRAKTDASAIGVLFARTFQSICSSDNIGPRILKMKQQVVCFDQGERIITSDRPLLRGHGLEHPQALLILPLGPRQLFVATNGPDADEALHWLTRDRDVIPAVNALTARQAFRHVYGVCENHLPLVSAEMGKGLALPWRLHAGGSPAI